MVKQSKSLPKMAFYLGYGGVLPFLGLAIAGVLGFQSQAFIGISVQAWMVIYGAVIISFLGAIHWGVVIALNDKINSDDANKLLFYGILPALLAWLGFLLPLHINLFFQAFLVLLTYFIDYSMLFAKLELAVSKELSRDFAKLRLHLSITVSVLLMFTAFNYG